MEFLKSITFGFIPRVELFEYFYNECKNLSDFRLKTYLDQATRNFDEKKFINFVENIKENIK